MLTFKALVKFIPEATPKQKQSWRDAVTALRSEVIELRSGEKVVIPGAEGLDGGWDDGWCPCVRYSITANAKINDKGVVMTHENMTKYAAYVKSPAHAQFIAAVRPIVAGIHST